MFIPSSCHATSVVQSCFTFLLPSNCVHTMFVSRYLPSAILASCLHYPLMQRHTIYPTAVQHPSVSAAMLKPPPAKRRRPTTRARMAVSNTVQQTTTTQETSTRPRSPSAYTMSLNSSSNNPKLNFVPQKKRPITETDWSTAWDDFLAVYTQ